MTKPAPSSAIRFKICGLTREDDVNAAVAAGANSIGFVLYPKSPRYISPERASQLARLLPPFVTPTLLFVNPTLEEVRVANESVSGATLQFHGDESGTFCEKVSRLYHCSWIKTARISTDPNHSFDFTTFAQEYANASAWLLDADSHGFGGSGQIFPWQTLPKRLPAHLILAGGLSAQNVKLAVETTRDCGLSLAVDVSSGVEAQDASGVLQKGIKDHDKIRQFARELSLAQQRTH